MGLEGSSYFGALRGSVLRAISAAALSPVPCCVFDAFHKSSGGNDRSTLLALRSYLLGPGNFVRLTLFTLRSRPWCTLFTAACITAAELASVGSEPFLSLGALRALALATSTALAVTQTYGGFERVSLVNPAGRFWTHISIVGARGCAHCVVTPATACRAPAVSIEGMAACLWVNAVCGEWSIGAKKRVSADPVQRVRVQTFHAA